MMLQREQGERASFRFADWPLRAKMAMLLLVVSVIPLAIAAFIDIRQAQSQLLAHTTALLAARADQLVDRLDMFHRGYEQSVSRLSRTPRVIAFCQATEPERDRMRADMRAVLQVFPASDPNLRDAAILDRAGVVRASTDDRLLGVDLSFHPFVHEALQGRLVV